MGRVGVITSAAAFLAGYNLRLLTVVQAMSQLDAVYGDKEARTFATNHGLQILYAPREQRDADEYSAMLGHFTERATSRGRSRSFSGHGHSTVSRNESEQRRALLLPQEFKELGSERLVVIFENCKPILGEKIRYHRDKAFTPRLLPAPAVPRMDMDLHLARVQQRWRYADDELAPGETPEPRGAGPRPRPCCPTSSKGRRTRSPTTCSTSSARRQPGDPRPAARSSRRRRRRRARSSRRRQPSRPRSRTDLDRGRPPCDRTHSRPSIPWLLCCWPPAARRRSRRPWTSRRSGRPTHRWPSSCRSARTTCRTRACWPPNPAGWPRRRRRRWHTWPRASRSWPPCRGTAGQPGQANSVFTVRFDFGSTRVVIPAEIAAALVADAKAAPLVLLRGRTDGTSDAPAESRIARDRAAAVRDYLVAAGVDPARIRATYQPAGDHVADNTSAGGRGLNRRVEIELYRALPVALSATAVAQP